jgi:hypothetical protein
MKRNFLILIILVFTLLKVNAQNVSLSLGSEFNFPSGNSSNISAIGVGGFLKAEIALNEKYAITAMGSLTNFFGRRVFGATSSNLTYVPLKMGFKYYSDESFYLEGQIGASTQLNGNRQTAIAWSPGIGTYIKSRKTQNKLDIGLRYEGWTSNQQFLTSGSRLSTFGFIGLKMGYVFGL